MRSKQLLANDITVRHVTQRDLESVVDFETEIARISFPDDPVTDRAVHYKKLAKAIERGPQGMFVLDRNGHVLGWLWITLNTNFLTGERYATFRSFAVDESLRGTTIPAEFFKYGLDYCRSRGVVRATGKVHVENVAMRVMYKNAGFAPTHLTMEINL